MEYTENDNQSNIAETLAREMKQPVEIISEQAGNMKRVALPPGWTSTVCFLGA